MNKIMRIFLHILFVVVCGFLGVFVASKASQPQSRTFIIEARRYAYNPPRIRVNRGDKVTIHLKSADVAHGFFLEGYDIEAKIRAQYPHFWVRHPSKKDEEFKKVEEITFVANKAGKFRYRCSITCGTFHPFMQGELVVSPNLAFAGSIGLTFGLALSMLAYFGWKKD